ncbi:MAG: winged helix-turn-helix domain-containing protein [Thermoleophilaceae bacterium]
MAVATTRSSMQAGDLEIRPREFMAIAGDRPLHLTARELDLLTALVEREGRIVGRAELYRTVWGEDYRKQDRSVDVYIGRLRQKLEDALPGRRFIHTHFGFGYRFQRDHGERGPR